MIPRKGLRSALCLIIWAMILFAPYAAPAQTAEERARISRLQAARTPCSAQPTTEQERVACSQRALAREVGRQDGYCWSAPDQANQSLAYRCTSRTLK